MPALGEFLGFRRHLTNFYQSTNNQYFEIKYVRKIDKSEVGEFTGIINYAVMALVQLELGVVVQSNLDLTTATKLYDEKVKITTELIEAKNHDYGEAFREIR